MNRKGAEKCSAPIINADELDAKIEKSLFTDLFRRPKTTVKNWFRQDELKKRKAKKIQASIDRLIAQIKKLETKGSQLLVDYGNEDLGGFSAKEINSQKLAINAEIRIREERIKSLTTDLKALGLIDIGPKEEQAIVEEVKSVVGDLKNKYKAMTKDDKRRLLEYYLPPTSCLQIDHATNEDGEKIKGYSFIHIGLVDRVALLTALSDYAKSGKVPAYTGKAVSHNRINAESTERRYMYINWLPNCRVKSGPSWIRSLK